MRKIILALILCFAAVVSLGACGANSSSAPAASGGTQNGSQFRTKYLLDEHYEKHVKEQNEFGNITKDEYLKLAQDLVDHASENVLTKEDSSGNTLYYDPDLNEFAVKSHDGYIRTFFKPEDGRDYYDRQT